MPFSGKLVSWVRSQNLGKYWGRHPCGRFLPYLDNGCRVGSQHATISRHASGLRQRHEANHYVAACFAADRIFVVCVWSNKDSLFHNQITINLFGPCKLILQLISLVVQRMKLIAVANSTHALKAMASVKTSQPNRR